jgi:hypothetical protein
MARKNKAPGESGSPSTAMMLAILAVAIVAVLGIVVALTGPGSSKQQADPAPSAGATGSGTSSDGGGSTPGAPACQPSDTDQSLPATPPADVTWKLVNTVALPASASAGPLVVDGLVARCYAHTPRGALMAALNEFYRVAVDAPALDVANQQLVPGPGRDALEAQLKTVDQTPVPGELAQIAGYRIVTYTATTTVVTLVNGQSSASSLRSQDVTVQWSGGDWKLTVQPNGQLASTSTSLTSLAGFTVFGGV